MAERFRMNGPHDFPVIHAAIATKGFPCTITITGAVRSLPQNALFHMWCEEVAMFFVRKGKTHFANGSPMNKDTMKRNLKQTFLGEQAVEDINLQTGEITTRYELKHTSQLDKGDMHYFMSQIDAWAMEHGIYLPHPEDSEYMKIMERMAA